MLDCKCKTTCFAAHIKRLEARLGLSIMWFVAILLVLSICSSRVDPPSLARECRKDMATCNDQIIFALSIKCKGRQVMLNYSGNSFFIVYIFLINCLRIIFSESFFSRRLINLYKCAFLPEVEGWGWWVSIP